MDYRSFWNLVRSRWLVLVTFALLGTIAAAAFTLTRQVDYSAQAELFVASVGSDNSSDLAQGSNYSQQQARIYSVVTTRQVVLEPVIETLGLDTTPRELASRVTATVPLNTSLITISVSDTSPERAADTANSIATSLVNTVIRLVPKRTDGTTPVRLETIQSATAPSVSSAPGRIIFLVGGLLAGIVAGLGLIVLRELSSARIRSAEQILAMDDLALLGSVVHDRRAGSTPLVPASGSGTSRFEEFRQIRTNLPTAGDPAGGNLIVITSAIPGEGRSITAANLAIAVAATGASVCLVEGDLRRPSLAQYFAVSTSSGLSEVLSGRTSLEESLVETDRGVSLLAAGSSVDNPSELLASDRTSSTIDALSTRFDVVLIDTPALLPVTDATILAKSTGRAIIVVGASKVEVREFNEALDTLDSSGVAVLGVIVNNVPTRAAGRYRSVYSRPRKPRQFVEIDPQKVSGRIEPVQASEEAALEEVGGAEDRAVSPPRGKSAGSGSSSSRNAPRSPAGQASGGRATKAKADAGTAKTYRVSKDAVPRQ